MSTQEETWKEFEQNPITHSAAHYLMAIEELLKDRGYARLTDIAKKLDITAGSCSISLKALKKKGLVEEDDNKFLRLSEKSKIIVEIVKKNDRLLQYFFEKVLGVSAKQADIDACKMEHLLSMETSFKLAAFVKSFEDGDAEALAFQELLKGKKPICWRDFSVKNEETE